MDSKLTEFFVFEFETDLHESLDLTLKNPQPRKCLQRALTPIS